MKEQIEAVKEFHEKFNITNGKSPKNLRTQEILLRYRLIEEESKEYLEAAASDNLVEIADALGDQLYILFGTVLMHGMQDIIHEVFNEIQRSNMSKLDADGKPITRADGKIMKSNRYFKPDIQAILDNRLPPNSN